MRRSLARGAWWVMTVLVLASAGCASVQRGGEAGDGAEGGAPPAEVAVRSAELAAESRELMAGLSEGYPFVFALSGPAREEVTVEVTQRYYWRGVLRKSATVVETIELGRGGRAYLIVDLSFQYYRQRHTSLVRVVVRHPGGDERSLEEGQRDGGRDDVGNQGEAALGARSRLALREAVRERDDSWKEELELLKNVPELIGTVGLGEPDKYEAVRIEDPTMPFEHRQEIKEVTGRYPGALALFMEWVAP